jgi:hypothetical protein
MANPDAYFVDAVSFALAAQYVPNLDIEQAVVRSEQRLCTNLIVPESV